MHISYLASDKLAGRLPGTKGEKLAGEYIKKQFESIGLAPAGDEGTFFEPFTFNTGFEYGKGNALKINGKKYLTDKDYYILPYSSNIKNLSAEIADVGYGIRDKATKKEGGAYTIEDYGSEVRKLEGKIFLINLGLPDNNPHGEYAQYADWAERLKIARRYKPAAIFFYNSPEPLTIEAFKKYNNLHQENIPLIHITPELANEIQKLAVTASQPVVSAILSVELKRKEVSGRNVIGKIDNGSKYTIVIGAHYDHLGHGEYGNSLAPNSHEVHNGADDNASGTAMLIELARIIKNREREKRYNFIFIAFSGEEEGLLGSNYFTKNSGTNMTDLDCMFNMDMVGRLDSTKNELGVIGTGTSPSWPKIMDEAHTSLKIKTTESGMSASDNTSFYIQNVPALHFFTGSHPDYHKPSDDADKINYAGMVKVTDYIYQIIQGTVKEDKLTFQKTKEDSATTPKFKVTFGIIPDYFFEGPGLRVDGVSQGKTAEKAGMKNGDIILQVGEYEIKDMRSYMEMLGKFKKGDKTQVKIKRGEEIITIPVQFQ
jgi:hypothetical protein